MQSSDYYMEDMGLIGADNNEVTFSSSYIYYTPQNGGIAFDKITTLNTNVSDFELETSNNFSAVNSALNEKANLSDLSKCASLADFNRLSATVTALESQVGDVSAVLDNINGEVI